MRAMILEQPGIPLVLRDLPAPEPKGRQVQLQVLACAVCRTDLHVMDGELPNPKLPLILGHEIVGRVARLGEQASHLLAVGQRVGVPWRGLDGRRPCLLPRGSGKSLVRMRALYRLYTLDGGATRNIPLLTSATASRFLNSHSDAGAAPLLCAGLIGYRSSRARAMRSGWAAFTDLRRRGPHHHASGPPSGPQRVRLHAPRR